MEIKLIHLGKRFNREWIFRNIDYTFNSSNCYAITGSNGSGKSTLLQVIAGSMMHNEGEIKYTNQNLPDTNPSEKIFKTIAIVAPYLELIEELTAGEMIQFHRIFKQLTNSDAEILQTIGLTHAENKQIRYFSSGMKQRLKLGLAFFSNTEILLLDEPCTNLDNAGIELYYKLIQCHSQQKLVIVCSNDKTEYNFCKEIISIEKYK